MAIHLLPRTSIGGWCPNCGPWDESYSCTTHENGVRADGNNLENLRRPDQTWKVRMIEEEFKRLMFDVTDV